MAVLRNREVSYLGPVSGHDATRAVRVRDAQGNEEMVTMGELRFTEQEKKDLQKTETDEFNNSVQTISDKDLKELRDSQDKAKIEARQNSENKDVTVPVSEVRVDKKAVK